MNEREIFLRHVAQTSPAPLAIEMAKAEGCILYDKGGNEYIDVIGGISVCNTGHRHPKVVAAIEEQLLNYLHVLVYGEMVQSPQVQYAKLLTEHLPATLSTVYFTNSGAEATEGALKLAKRATGRTQILAFNKSYHGSTHGALSVMGDEYWRNAYRPLLPGVWHATYNDVASIDLITSETACVIAETVQAESGIVVPEKAWLQALRKKCDDTGTLLILDEIQAGLGRTGTLWAFEQFGVIPDILLLGKALGGGMPLGAFVASHQLMSVFTHNPVLGHITTFGGHPVCCAAGMASMSVLLEEEWISAVKQKEQFLRGQLKHAAIKDVRSFGLWVAVVFDSFDTNKKVIDACIQKGVLTDWFLFAPECLRISPPLVISEAQLKAVAAVIIDSLNNLY